MLKSVSPSEGSTSGGTKITITSQHVVGPVSNIAVEVAGDFTLASFNAHAKKLKNSAFISCYPVLIDGYKISCII